MPQPPISSLFLSTKNATSNEKPGRRSAVSASPEHAYVHIPPKPSSPYLNLGDGEGDDESCASLWKRFYHDTPSESTEDARSPVDQIADQAESSRVGGVSSGHTQVISAAGYQAGAEKKDDTGGESKLKADSRRAERYKQSTTISIDLEGLNTPASLNLKLGSSVNREPSSNDQPLLSNDALQAEPGPGSKIASEAKSIREAIVGIDEPFMALMKELDERDEANGLGVRAVDGVGLGAEVFSEYVDHSGQWDKRDAGEDTIIDARTRVASTTGGHSPLNIDAPRSQQHPKPKGLFIRATSAPLQRQTSDAGGADDNWDMDVDHQGVEDLDIGGDQEARMSKQVTRYNPPKINDREQDREDGPDQPPPISPLRDPAKLYPGISPDLLIVWASGTFDVGAFDKMVNLDEDAVWTHRLGPRFGDIVIKQELSPDARLFLTMTAKTGRATQDEVPEWIVKMLMDRVEASRREEKAKGKRKRSNSTSASDEDVGIISEVGYLMSSGKRRRKESPLFGSDEEDIDVVIPGGKISTRTTPSLVEVSPGLQADELIIVTGNDDEIECTGDWSPANAWPVTHSDVMDRQWASFESRKLREAILKYGYPEANCDLVQVKKYMDAATRKNLHPKWSIQLLRFRWTEEFAVLRQCEDPLSRALRAAVFCLGEDHIEETEGKWDLISEKIMADTGDSNATAEVLRTTWYREITGERSAVLRTKMLW